MSKTIEVILDTVKKERNSEEYRYVNRASCPEYNLEEVGDGKNLTKVLKQLLEYFPDGEVIVEVKRDNKLAFNRGLLKDWFYKQPQPESLKKKVEEE